jgi:hypothetical protein
MKLLTIILPVALLAGCKTAPMAASVKPIPPAAPLPVAPVAGTDLDQGNTQRVRVGETMKAYPIGRYVDPNDPNVMHESHVVYRKEADSSWNLLPNAPTAVPLGPVIAVAEPAKQPNPLPAELEQKVATQNQLMASLIEQNEALAAELGKLNKEIAELRQKSSPAQPEGGK